MNTAPYRRQMPTPVPAVMVVTGTYVGHTEVGAPKFKVPIQEVKPLNPHPCSVMVSWRGDKNQKFDFGAKYSLVVETRTWETTIAERLYPKHHASEG